MANNSGNEFSYIIGQSPYFNLLTDPSLSRGLSGQGKMAADILQYIMGTVSAPRVSSAYPAHVQTSPGVYESAYRVAGQPDPRFDQNIIERQRQEQVLQKLLGAGGTSNDANTDGRGGAGGSGASLYFGSKGGGVGGAGLYFGGRGK